MGAVPGLNLRGVSAFCRALLREPQLLLPQLSVAGACCARVFAVSAGVRWRVPAR